MESQYFEVSIIIEDRVLIEADDERHAERLVQHNIRDYITPSSALVFVEAVKVDACTLLDQR